MVEQTFRLFQKAIPTNVITGFLGVGKTTAIQQLLKSKPAGERWAVLINEFGKVGIDSQLLQTDDHSLGELTIREVPGGCMCCAAGLPMKVALNQLIGKAKPDRLLIEPSGLGHPKEVIAVLSGEFYRSIIDLRATLTLVDARHIADAKYREHETFQQQLQIADLIVANKSDMYGQSEVAALNVYLNEMHLQELPLHITQDAKINPEWLKPNAKFNQAIWQEQPTVFNLENEEQVIPDCGYLAAAQKLSGWYSYGWRFKSTFSFDYQSLMTWLEQFKQLRLKAVFRTGKGFITINQADDNLTIQRLDTQAKESRIELITDKPLDAKKMESQLLQMCGINHVNPS
ncbi:MULTISPECIES: CobW family GTP-binding protein [unclassified Methylophaga]|uniref:CobW family GTP-binding protein n=1 Tax=unclassified Methylophaga TaxID=2629249 RepID=UPI000C8DF6AD|nr:MULTISPECIES: GTP-binding protein [unclassified Methylophaga]MAP26537.1 transposase [Methylophaga sp.]HBX61205.1 transposase [Methylophaga sp.]HCO00070.1 transposase [Methylophaga sp.]